MKKIISLFAVLMFCTSVGHAAPNKKLEILGTFGDWTAYSAKEKGGKLCYMASVPQKSEGKYKRRGDVILIVAHRPQEKSYDVVSLTTGYTYKAGSKASVQVDKQKAIELFTHEDTAWGNDSKTDAKIVRQMKAGNKAVFKGKSSLGTLTTDTFSLSGFTKAYRAMSNACGR